MSESNIFIVRKIKKRRLPPAVCMQYYNIAPSIKETPIRSAVSKVNADKRYFYAVS